jgi:hypothetical protein
MAATETAQCFLARNRCNMGTNTVLGVDMFVVLVVCALNTLAA